MTATIAAPEIEYTEPTEVDRDLLPDLIAFIKKYVVLPSDEHALILALWALHTWTFASARTTPYLYVHSADKQSGKTRLLEVMEVLCRNSLRATNVTPSVLFRAIDRMDPTLMIDEVDTIWAGARNEMMRGIINGGYKIGGFVLRIQNQQPTKYNTFCPKILAGIYNGFIPDTIADRCIPIKLRRKKAGEQCERFFGVDVLGSRELGQLLDRVETFVNHFSHAVAVQRPEPVEGISDRQGEISEPLVALGVVLGCEGEVRSAVAAMFADLKEAPSAAEKMLSAIKAAFGDDERIFTGILLDRMGNSMSGKMLATWLAPYGIHPEQIRIVNQTGSGYKREWFERAWA
jgi:hypothetical protein